MADQVTISKRFRGPPDSGNGGYSVGVVAGFVGDSAEVTLKAPPPLDTPLDVVRRNGSVLLERAGAPIAEGHTKPSEIEVPEPVSFQEAKASRSYIGFAGKTFMECFVCGPDRDEGDGLRIFAGGVPGRDLVAAPWVPGEGLAATDGKLDARFLWAALDCPTYFACASAFGESMSLLGRLSGSILQRPSIDTQLVVMAWPVGQEGRKQFANSAVIAGSGDLVAIGEATWIELRG